MIMGSGWIVTRRAMACGAISFVSVVGVGDNDVNDLTPGTQMTCHAVVLMRGKEGGCGMTIGTIIICRIIC